MQARGVTSECLHIVDQHSGIYQKQTSRYLLPYVWYQQVKGEIDKSKFKG